MKIDIRPAGPEDGPFLAWVMLAATRSHLSDGVWEHFVGGSERDCLSFLSLIATTHQSHLFHYSTFIIAEMNGQKAGAFERYLPWTTCVPKDSEGAWIVESVAVLPEYRRQGVISTLLTEVLETGRRGEYPWAQIGVLINIDLPGGPMRNKDLNLMPKKEILNSKPPLDSRG
jgi:GNAT superfamily N-acetyltransferase